MNIYDPEIKVLTFPDKKTIEEKCAHRDFIFVLVRHNGCTFCRETLGLLKENLDLIRNNNLSIAVVHMGSQEDSESLKNEFNLDSVEMICDPDQKFYKAFGAKRGKLSEVINPNIIWNGLRSGALFKYGIGKPEADIYQLGGIYRTHRGQITCLHRPKDSSDTFRWKNLL